jgi:uroporphyrinogen decarboxylase
LNSRERVSRAIRFKRPDRIPYFHRFLDATRRRYPELIASIEARYPGDMADSCWHIPPLLSQAGQADSAHSSADEWGCVRATGIAGLTGLVVVHPLSDWRALANYPWPDYRTLYNWESVQSLIDQHPDQHHVAQIPSLNLFERMQALRGFEPLMLDLAEKRTEVYELRDRIVDIMLVAIGFWLRTDVDAIGFGDDWGTQTAMMISPTMWRDFFRPAYARLFEPIRRAGKFIRFHSDGLVLPIIQDLIDLGVDVINVQQNLVGLDRLKSFRGCVCFLTYMDTQSILPYGTPADVRDHVRQVFASLGTPDGGVLGYAPIGPDVPPENIEALYLAYDEYGLN